MNIPEEWRGVSWGAQHGLRARSSSRFKSKVNFSLEKQMPVYLEYVSVCVPCFSRKPWNPMWLQRGGEGAAERAEKPTGVPVSNIAGLFRYSAGVVQINNSAHMRIFRNLYFMFLRTRCCIIRQSMSKICLHEAFRQVSVSTFSHNDGHLPVQNRLACFSRLTSDLPLVLSYPSGYFPQ